VTGLRRPPKSRELIALLAAVVVADITIYSGGGFAGLGVLFWLFPLVLLFGAQRRRSGPTLWVTLGLLVALGVRLLWLGTEGAVALGFFLLLGFSMALIGLKPFILEGVLYATVTVASGIERLGFYIRRLPKKNTEVRPSWLVWFVPLVALLAFGGIFVLANPVLRVAVSTFFSRIFENLGDVIPSPGRMLFWFAVLWVTAGLLRPYVDRTLARMVKRKPETVKTAHLVPPEAWFYPMARNTLAVLIALFAVYLVFELYYLWFREFPEGFYYSGYAHEGAAWLTVALALATLVIGVVFQGRLLRHPSLGRLKRLAWTWSVENFTLAVCVFHRTQIYVDYNGMSRMRVVALFGIAVVVAGFVLVIVKVARGKNFLWLVRRQLWALAITVVLLALMPVDWIVTRYNVKQVLGGNPVPIVQIVVHRINAGGLPQLVPLLNGPDPAVREGVAALLAEEEEQLQAAQDEADEKGWSHTQFARTHALEALKAHRGSWAEYADSAVRRPALEAFRAYARRWYD